MPCPGFIMKHLEQGIGKHLSRREIHSRNREYLQIAEGITWRKDLTKYLIIVDRRKTMGRSIEHASFVYNESCSVIRVVQQQSVLGIYKFCVTGTF